MYIHEISLNYKATINKSELFDQFNLLMQFYRGNGQTQEMAESQYITDKKIVCFPNTLEEGSLNKKLNNFYVNRQIRKIEELYKSKLKFKMVGLNYDYPDGPCNCKKSDFYILITNYTSIDSPLCCGSCNKSIPLYRLPIYYDYGYLPVLSWQTNYKACDTLQMNC